MRRKWKQIMVALLTVTLLMGCFEPYGVLAADGDEKDDYSVDSDEPCDGGSSITLKPAYLYEYMGTNIPEGIEYSNEDINDGEEALQQWSGTRQTMREIAAAEIGETDSSRYGASSGEEWCA